MHVCMGICACMIAFEHMHVCVFVSVLDWTRVGVCACDDVMIRSGLVEMIKSLEDKLSADGKSLKDGNIDVVKLIDTLETALDAYKGVNALNDKDGGFRFPEDVHVDPLDILRDISKMLPPPMELRSVELIQHQLLEYPVREFLIVFSQQSEHRHRHGMRESPAQVLVIHHFDHGNQRGHLQNLVEGSRHRTTTRSHCKCLHYCLLPSFMHVWTKHKTHMDRACCDLPVG